MPSVVRELPLEHPLYTTDDLWAIRRGVLLYARSFPPGPERNQHRQIALSVRKLFRSEKWLNQHMIDGAWRRSGPHA